MAMISLTQTTLFNKDVDKNLLQDTCKKIRSNIGIITPKNIEVQLFNLKKSSLIKRSPLLQAGINAYESDIMVHLFNTTIPGNVTQNNLTTVIPYIVDDKNNSIYMNLNRMCNWNDAMDTIENLNELSDLRAILEIGHIFNRMKACKLFENAQFIQHMTSAYTILFMNVISKCLGVSQAAAIDTTIVNMKFCIAKFFLLHNMGMLPTDESVNAIAYVVSKNNASTFNSTVMYEENTGIKYNNITSFLSTYANTFFGNNLNLTDFVVNWMKLYGEATRLAIEFPPILLYYLYATYYNARLGSNNTKLVTRYKEQIAFDLNKIVSVIYTTIR